MSIKIFKHKTERHHIIAKIHSRAKEARDIFVKECGRNINDDENIARVRTKYHKVMYTTVYFDAINDCIRSAYQTGGDSAVITVLKELQDVLEDL